MSCLIDTIRERIVGNATSYKVVNPTTIFIPENEERTLQQTELIAKERTDTVNKEYNSKVFGVVATYFPGLNKPGTVISIKPSQALLKAYEVKEGNATIEEVHELTKEDLQFIEEQEARDIQIEDAKRAGIDYTDDYLLGISSSIINELNQDNNNDNRTNTRGSYNQEDSGLFRENISSIFNEGFNLLWEGGRSNNGFESFNQLREIQDKLKQGETLSSDGDRLFISGDMPDFKDSLNPTLRESNRSNQRTALRFIQSLYSNKLNSRLRKKLGLDSITFVDNDNPVVYIDTSNPSTIYLNINKIHRELLSRNNQEEFIDLAVFEELIHLAILKVNTPKQLKEAEDSLVEGGYVDTISSIYFNDSIRKLTPSQALQEGVRMRIQEIFTGKTTEDTINDPSYNKIINSILRGIWNYLKEFFTNDVPNKTIVNNITRYINEDLTSETSVPYTLKALNILQSDKAIAIFEKGKKSNWSLDKILQELQIPKEQKQLILSLAKTSREDIITDLLSNYTYTVEINIAKQEERIQTQTGDYNLAIQYFAQPIGGGRYMIMDQEGESYEDFDTIEQADRALESRYISSTEFKDEYENTGKIINTNYYSNLTVPGGTNYTENEISTPLITPSIKGHAQFATDNGLMWSRTDEKIQYQENEIDKLLKIMENSEVLRIKCS